MVNVDDLLNGGLAFLLLYLPFGSVFWIVVNVGIYADTCSGDVCM
jgi:hypothetical protein